MSSPEHLSQSGERGHEAIGAAAAERQAELVQSHERTTDQSPEQHRQTVEHAASDAERQAVSLEKPPTEQVANASDTHTVRPSRNRQAREKAYKSIMQHTQAEMKPAERTFSKVIHQPVVEKTSAVLGSTVARPNAILFGALFALILSGGVYALAKYYNYTLSGFEAIGAFIAGWLFGMLVDFARLAFRRH
jgi:hypothetical protein